MTELAHDYLDLDGLFSAEELELRDRVRRFVQERIKPNIAGWYEAGHFPRELVKELGTLGVLGMHLTGYGCAGRSAVEYGLMAMELEAGDSGLRTFVSVQGSLAMSAIHKFGSEEHKQRWLPGMATGELVGCFGLTEPPRRNDSVRPSSSRIASRRRSIRRNVGTAKRLVTFSLARIRQYRSASKSDSTAMKGTPWHSALNVKMKPATQPMADVGQ